MAVKEVKLLGTYLMGRLVNSKGVAFKNSKYYPLPYQTLAFEKTKEISYENGKCTITPDSPVAFSDKNGRLNYFSSVDTQKLDSLFLGTPVTVSGTKSALFFPTYLVPMAQASYQGNWLPELYEKLEIDGLQNSRVDLESRKRPLVVDEFLDPSKVVKNVFASEYSKWHENTFSAAQVANNIQIIEIPQFYTIVLTFSSEQFVDTKITMSDFPQGVRLVGDAKDSSLNSPTSTVKAVNYTDEKGVNKEYFAATFWIETELLEVSLEPKQQYCRFDVDIDKAKGKTALIKYGIPKKYSLSEQVLHLPIQTAAGRTTLVNGDPISVEEALVNHAPQYFSNILNRTITQPLEEPEKLLMEKKDKTLYESMWHNLQTYKGFYEAGAGMLESGPSWAVISKTYNAAFGLSGSNSTVPQLVSNILGISGAASQFLELAEKFKTEPPALKGAKAVANALNIGKYPVVEKMVQKASGNAGAYLIPDRLRPFVGQHKPKVNALGKVVGKALGTPLSVAELMYNFHTSLKLSDEAGNHEKKLFNITADYTNYIQSAVEQMSLVSRSEFDKHKDKIVDTKNKLQKKLLDYQSGGEKRVLSVSEKLGNFSVQLINVGFNFDKAKVDINSDGEEILGAIADHLSQLSDPINIKVIGHTCFIGSDEYNMRLSVRRAKAFKEALIAKVDPPEEMKPIWESRIETIGRGEKEPLFDNNNLSERRNNRRVEVQFLFNTAFQYPPCRSGISAIESQRRATVASKVSEEGAWINTVSGAFDIALGIGAGFLGPIGVSAYALWWAGGMVNTGMGILNQATNKNYDHFAKLKQYSEFGVVTQSMLVNNDPKIEISSFIKKAYLKRALALNGLIRLIHRYHYEKSHKSNTNAFSDFNVERARATGKEKLLDDYDFEGYIKHFLLDDSWEIAHDYLPVYLDEVWLQELSQKGIRKVDDYASIQSYISGMIYLKNKLLQNDATEEHLEIGQRYQSTFPIHYLSSKNFEYFHDLFVEKTPSFGDDILKKIVISARRRGSDSKSDWLPLDNYLKTSAHNSLSPYDQIRILILFNNEEKHFKALFNEQSESKAPLMIPVSAQPVRRNLFFDDLGNTSTEYVTQLRADDLCKFEKDAIEFEAIGKKENIYGAIIQPKFLLGANIIPGTRPMADYDDSTLESLFLDEKARNTKTQHKGASGHFAMSYYYQVFIPGTKVSNKISYGTKGHSRHKRKKIQFPLTLDPERKYKIKQNTANGASLIEVQDDHLLYEENFLKTEKRDKTTCPQVFKNPRVNFTLYQNGHPLKPKAGKDWIKFNWNDEAEILAVIYTKSMGIKHLVAQHIDTDIFPVNVTLLSSSKWEDSNDEYDIKLAQASAIHRIGMIRAEGNKASFEETPVEKYEFNEYKWLKDKFIATDEEELSRLMANDAKSVFDSPEPVDTDVFAVRIPLEYINAAGKKMKGLKPMPSLGPFNRSVGSRRNAAAEEEHKDNQIYLCLSLSSAEGAGLKNHRSNRIIIDKSGDFENGEKIPSNWFYHTDKDRENGIAMIKTNEDENSTPHEKVEAIGKLEHSDSYVQTHSRTKLMQWIEAGDRKDTMKLSLQRKGILKVWIKGEGD